MVSSSNKNVKHCYYFPPENQVVSDTLGHNQTKDFGLVLNFRKL